VSFAVSAIRNEKTIVIMEIYIFDKKIILVRWNEFFVLFLSENKRK